METEETKKEKGAIRAIGDFTVGGVISFIDWWIDLLRIYTWLETWVPILFASAIFGWCGCFAFALTLSNPWKTIFIWGFLFGVPLGLGAGAIFLSVRRQ